MKSLFKLIIIALLALISFSVTAQTITRIPIEPYTMLVPDVSFLEVKDNGYEFDYVTANFTPAVPDSIVVDSVTSARTAYYDGHIIIKQGYYKIYYKLLKNDLRVAWDGNWTIPSMMYPHIIDYKTGTVTPSTIETLSQFFIYAGLPEIKPVMPVPQPEE